MQGGPAQRAASSSFLPSVVPLGAARVLCGTLAVLWSWLGFLNALRAFCVDTPLSALPHQISSCLCSASWVPSFADCLGGRLRFIPGFP